MEIKDSEGKLAGYKLTGNHEVDARIKYEVERAEDKGRLSRMESHISDLKIRTEKFEDKFDAFGTFFREWVQTVSAQTVTHERQLSGEPGKKGILERLTCAEIETGKLKVSARVIAWLIPISLTAFGLILHFWK